MSLLSDSPSSLDLLQMLFDVSLKASIVLPGRRHKLLVRPPGAPTPRVVTDLLQPDPGRRISLGEILIQGD